MKTKDSSVIELEITSTKVISLKIDTATLSEIEQLYRKYNYRSRSEFIREALHFYIALLKRYNDKEKVMKILNELI